MISKVPIVFILKLENLRRAQEFASGVFAGSSVQEIVII